MKDRMRLTFDMYDFNNDGKISREDVRILLSYVPQVAKKEEFDIHNLPLGDEAIEPLQDTEGLYEGKD